MNIRDRSANGGQGMHWIRPAKRLAIYLRDGLACVWCGATVEDGAQQLQLDHLTPHSRGGSNGERNLVTCCPRCNSSRGARSTAAFSSVVAAYLDHGITGATILSHVRTTARRALDVAAAKELIARRGGFAAACKETS